MDGGWVIEGVESDVCVCRMGSIAIGFLPLMLIWAGGGGVIEGVEFVVLMEQWVKMSGGILEGKSGVVSGVVSIRRRLNGCGA